MIKNVLLNILNQQNALDFKQEIAFKKICKLFEDNNIRYCPIKGADLAWRVYPTGAIRHKCDIDILVHYDDCSRAKSCLLSIGWEMPYDYKNNVHFPVMSYQGLLLEIHYNLPKFEQESMNIIWDDLMKINEYRYQLPLELNLLLLFNHCRKHKWQFGVKMLLDCCYLIKYEGEVDMAKLTDWTDKYQLASPKLLFSALPEFFAKELLSGEFSQEESLSLRRLILYPMDLFSDHAETVMSAVDRFSLSWWQSCLRGMHPSVIRLVSRNAKGNYLKLLLGYFKVIVQKISNFFKYLVGDNGKKAYLKEVEQLEKSFRKNLKN